MKPPILREPFLGLRQDTLAEVDDFLKELDGT